MLPNLIIIGAAKSGTTSLHYYLSLHPQISMSEKKELDFFIGELNWNKGIRWYESYFTGEAAVFGESSPRYTLLPRYRGVAERMHLVVPEARLIYVLRDPVERIISHYTYNRHGATEERPFQSALKEDDRYLCGSKYCMQLEQYLKYYSLSKILIITAEELYQHRTETLQKVFRFLDVDDSFCTPKFSGLKLETRYQRRKNRVGLLLERLNNLTIVNRIPRDLRDNIGKFIYIPFSEKSERLVLTEDVRQELIRDLKDDIDRLRKLTGQTFEHWCL